MKASTSALPTTDMSINGAFRIQLMMTIELGRKLSSMLLEESVPGMLVKFKQAFFYVWCTN